MTSKKEEKFRNPDLKSMFATNDNIKPGTKKPATKVAKKQTITNNTKASSVNRPAKKTKSTTETRSQRKQFLFTKKASVNMKVLAMSKGISVNEMVNEVMENYIKRQFKQHPEYETAASTLLKAEN